MFIDGYNFYCAIKNNPRQFPIYLGWCNFAKLAREAIVKGRGDFVRIKYFTAPVEEFQKPGGELGGEAARQKIWLSALETIPELKIVCGFHSGDRSAPASHRYRTRKEKETDVNIALTLVLDAAKNLYDRAIVLTGDYDQMPAVKTVAEEFYKSVEVWLPPGHQPGNWARLNKGRIGVHHISEQDLIDSRLPETISHNGSVIRAPDIWCSPN